MRSHFIPDSRVLMACAAGASTILTGQANAQIASDNPLNAAYADGWQAGDNGGFGFTGWSFYGTYTNATQHAIDSTSPYNQLGTAWTLYLPNGNTPQGTPDSPNGPPGPGGTGPDLSRAGRGFSEGALQIGQTISVTVDNPTERRFFKGYTIKLISGGQNNGYFDPTAKTRLAVGTFEYFSYGKWYAGPGLAYTPLSDTDTDAGVRIDMTLTGTDSYHLTMTPLDHPELAFSKDGALENSGPVDWIMFEHYNTDSDFYDASGPHVAPNPQATDLYIGSMSIVPEPSSLAFFGIGSAGILFMRRRKK